jgi:hypothetical protein
MKYKFEKSFARDFKNLKNKDFANRKDIYRHFPK